MNRRLPCSLLALSLAAGTALAAAPVGKNEKAADAMPRIPSIGSVQGAEYDDALELQAHCTGGPSIACDLARAALASELIEELGEVSPYEPEVGALVKASLEVDDPEVQEAALELLGASQVAPAGPELVRVLQSDRPRLRLLALHALNRTTAETGKKFVDRHWRTNLPVPASLAPDRAPDLAAAGFRPYPGARRFALAEDAYTSGLLAQDPVEKVIAFYRAGDAKPLTTAQFLAEAGPGAGAETDEQRNARMKRAGEDMQRRVQEAMNRGDLAAVQKIALEAQEMSNQAMEDVKPRMGVPAMVRKEMGKPESLPDSARWVVTERKDGAAVRAVLAYPEPLLGGTAIRYFWMPAQ